MKKMDHDKMVDAKSWDELNNKLAENPMWQKVRRFSILQDIFLCVSFGSAGIHITFDPGHPYWSVAFLVAGLMSLVFGGISMKIFREYFARKNDITEEATKD